MATLTLLYNQTHLFRSGVQCVERKKRGAGWTAVEAERHINVLELQAAFFALKCFCSNHTRRHIQIQIDNTTALAYINHMGGTKSIQLDSLTIDLWNWCIARYWVSGCLACISQGNSIPMQTKNPAIFQTSMMSGC